MKKIIIFGFPHCGTTILRAIIGHIEEVYEIIGETKKININESEILKTNPEKKYILCKDPYIDNNFYTAKYSDYIKIFILRNPLYVISSINRRFKNKKIINNHSLSEYIKTCKLFNKKNEENEKINNLYHIKYEDLFDNNYQNLKDLFNKIGFNYTDDIFDNSKYTNFSHVHIKQNPSSIKNVKYTDVNHDFFRNMQINEPFVNNNTPDKINLKDSQIKEIINNQDILELYPNILELCSNMNK